MNALARSPGRANRARGRRALPHPGPRRGAERLDVVRRDHAGELVVAEPPPSGGPWPGACAPVRLRQHAVGHLADHALQERVLASLGGRGSTLVHQELLAHELRSRGSSVSVSRPATATRRLEREALPQDGGVLQERSRSLGSSASRREAMSACSVSGISSAPRSPTSSYRRRRAPRGPRGRRACGRSPPRRAARPRRDRRCAATSSAAKTEHEPRDQLGHRTVGERLEAEGR